MLCRLKDIINFLSMTSKRGISAMTLVLFWTEIIVMPIKMQGSQMCSVNRSLLLLLVRRSFSEVYSSTLSVPLCQMHFLILVSCWFIWIFKCFDGQCFLFYCLLQCFLRLSFSSVSHLVSEPEMTLQRRKVCDILRRCLQSFHHCPWPTPAMMHRCSLLSYFDVSIHT